jgi:hypothetical protein
MTELEQQELMRAIAVFVQERVDRAIEQRMKEFRFVGAHEAEMKYLAGNFVVKGGSLWHCRSDTKMSPGETADWVLVAKRGADGRDANRVATRPGNDRSG